MLAAEWIQAGVQRLSPNPHPCMENKMPDEADDKAKPVPEAAKPTQQTGQDTERMEDEEKIIEGRHDVNYPALLTKDVPGG
jgi:hypothetical protein